MMVRGVGVLDEIAELMLGGSRGNSRLRGWANPLSLIPVLVTGMRVEKASTKTPPDKPPASRRIAAQKTGSDGSGQ